MRKKITIFVLSLLAVAVNAKAQEAPYKYDFGGSIGMSGYLGDANTASLLKHPGFTANIIGSYLPNVRWAFVADLGYTTLRGNSAEMQNVFPLGETYSFTSNVFSLDVRAQFNFLPYGIGESYKRLSRITPYLTVGLGACLSSSEGTTAVASTLPMGAGVKFKASQRMNLHAEFTMTKVFGDKVDNIVDPNGIKTSFFKNTDWYSRFTVGVTFEFGERCATCHYVD